MSMNTFNPNELITNPKLLFGRQKELEIIVNTIKCGTNRQVQGEKRIGKTCFLHCAKSLLEGDSCFVSIYFDCKKLNRFKGTANFYRYVISVIVTEITRRKLLDCEHTLKSFRIIPSIEYEDTYERLLSLSDFRIESFLEDLIPYYSDLFDIRFVLLIDEYEYMMTTILDNPQGFMLLRALSDLPKIKGIKPLTYILSGSWPWQKVCTYTGSPELNNQGASILFLGSIDYMDFNEMYDYYTDGKEFYISPSLLYDMSGGVPFFAKKIAETVSLGENKPTSAILKEDFTAILNNLSSEEKKQIGNIISKKKINRPICERLRSRGILKENEGVYLINGVFLQEFFAQNLKDEDSSVEILDTLVNDIFLQIERINLNYKNNGRGNYLFEPITDEHSMHLQFRKICVDSNDFQVFINSVYRCIFERTAEDINGTRQTLLRMPRKLKTHEFKIHIDSFRQIFIHQSTSKEFKPKHNQLRREELNRIYLGKANEPISNDFILIQRKILINFRDFLVELEQEIV